MSKQMKNKLTLISGILIMLASIWGGAFGIHKFEHPHWASVPIFLTAVFIFFCGYGIMISVAENEQNGGME